jgi:pimeloyl-ACP methyl ester carboxylesterase/tellurite resistance protein
MSKAESKSKAKVPTENQGGTGNFLGMPLPVNPLTLGQQALEYWVDAAQRSVMFVDTLRQRSNMHIAHENSETPTVLHFKYEMILDGKKLVHPVNYHLLKILPPEGVVTDPKKRPFIVFDPRAGHGPGIGGMKEDSEIGNTLRAGHPAYFVGFLPNPIPGQTVEHVCEAEAIFIEKVIELHPEAEKPCLIGNCQAGWQIAMVGATYPELVGVLILAGAPMSFWNGVRGKDFLRYMGGLVGGSWMVGLANDLGNGKFDGAALVSNFERMNPSNTYWKKAHNLYSKIDSEVPRFLEFEKWWGSPVLLDRNEIQLIVDSLFIGNRLSAARMRTADGLRLDLRNIKSPILIFCSQGDDITPPPQALGWITDLYRADEEIIAAGQTIIYCMHQSIGHLGIFVASSVATKEHDKFIKNIDLIETLPPGLYEAVFSQKDAGTQHAGLASGDFVLSFEQRTLDDIRKIGTNSPEDDRRFFTAKRVSENICGVYDAYVSPWVRALATEQSAELIRQMNPIRIRYGMFSDRNPFLSGIGKMAEHVKANRKPVSHDNFFWKMQEIMSDNIVSALDAYRDARDSFEERSFLEIYGSRLLQSALGLRRSDMYSKFAGRDLDRERDIERRMHDLLNMAHVGGLPEALTRALLYVVRAGGGFDEREFKMLKQLCDASTMLPKMSQAELKALLRQQHEILVLDEQNAMEAISKLLDNSTDAAAAEALSAIHQVIKAHGDFSAEEKRRLQKLETYFVPSHTTPRRRATDIEIFAKKR